MPTKSALSQEKVSYVGGASCKQCHSTEYQAWQNSHHDKAMQPASALTVLGNFNNTKFEYFGVQSRFYKRGDTFYVETDGPDGELQEYPIAYTFGVYPLQQYLIAFPGGRLQALNLVWDSREKEQGGQRWFHLYPDENIRHDDELHWTGLNQNWNYMCADCHSTNLNKNYDLDTDSYHTSWTDINVNCEACHGPASEHLRWAENPEKYVNSSGKGFSFQFDQQAVWRFINPDSTAAQRFPTEISRKEVETCAACHSRRTTSHPGTLPGDPLLEHFQPSLLTPPLYHVDGQVNGEVYVYGSFAQSKMYQAGVTCSDCHDPHSLKLRASGNQICAQCHLPTKFDTQTHHLHKQGSEGAQCINCHMPVKNFMVVDARNDHSFRIPRPDLSSTLGVPNTCNQCHSDESSEWAAEILEKHFGKPGKPHFAQALAAGLSGAQQAESQLAKLIFAQDQPAIARATAVSLLPNNMASQQSAMLLQQVAQSDEPWLGYALASVGEQIPAQHRPIFMVPLLYESSPVTQGLAAKSLAGISLSHLPADVNEKYQLGIKAFLDSNTFNADRPESLTNLANYFAEQNLTVKAADYYHKAISKAAYYTPAYINLSEVYRRGGDENKGRTVLQSALGQVQDASIIEYALGLSFVRDKQMDQALAYLESAATSQDAPAHYIYVYSVALDSAGQTDKAIQVLKQGLRQYPKNPNLSALLSSINQKRSGHN
ncbi:tetratricopeptide repeat protein [Bowmanella sp. Y26]|uniref:multiheme c-type cytochrome n=1 Tax=Bowmanella yangjiangensis TaxID=2811230 RepID=UPI001BDD00DA|nr:multiheme c-type cytochrome [Bowmanella yangjiangensis]MBT1063974.1 tetratricopeptide repeat protein [Bowmanella yangjiangensis]